MTDDQTTSGLLEVRCPDCKQIARQLLGAMASWLPSGECATCGGHGKVLVNRKDLIRLSGVSQ